MTLSLNSFQALVQDSLPRCAADNVLQLWVGDAKTKAGPNPIITAAFDSSALMQLVDRLGNGADAGEA